MTETVERFSIGGPYQCITERVGIDATGRPVYAACIMHENGGAGLACSQGIFTEPRDAAQNAALRWLESVGQAAGRTLIHRFEVFHAA